MPLIQELGNRQIRQCLDEAIRRGIPVGATWRTGQQWHNLRTRILRRAGRTLWLELASPPPEDAPEPPTGQEVGLSFKLKHHKHIFNVTVEALGHFQPTDGQDVPAILATAPVRMQRVQRRAYLRAEVPPNRSVLATFRMTWTMSDQSSAEDGPTWEGWLTNLSAGGFRVRLIHGAPQLDAGDLVSVVIEPGQEYEPITSYAQFRQHSTDQRSVAYQGFQFVGLNETPDGRKMLQHIGEIVTSFQRIQGRRRANSLA